MQIITNEAHNNELNIIDLFFKPEDIILFDIETTGFAAETTTLYLIGCCYYSEGKWFIRQWFNDDGNSESDILKSFDSFIANYKYLLHYNGDGFDIPYLNKKYSKYNITACISKIESIDLYKLLRPFKSPLHLENLKQKSLEKFLGINRLDKYSGGDLIKIYEKFVSSRSLANKTLLLQHNYEDLEGLLCNFCMLSYQKFKNGCFNVSKMSVNHGKLLFSLILDYPLPKRISLGVSDILITAYKKEATISCPIIQGELKFYMDNYKDYYYLPIEDMAVHKSVATYVDRNYRQQAKKETCYLKRNGCFISQVDSGIVAGYKKDFSSCETFVELVDSFLQDIDMLNSYARHIVMKAF